MEYPKNVPDVQSGLAELSQHECLVTMDALMSRRHHNHRDLRFQVSVWRRERLAWKAAQDKRNDERDSEDV